MSRWARLPIFFNSDDKPGDGGGGKDGAGSDNAGKGAGDDNTGQGGSDNGGKPPKEEPKKPVEFSAEQHAEINRIVAKATREAERKAKEKADQDKLAEQGKYQELHTALQKRVTEELEPKAAERDTLATEVNASIDSEIADWAASLKEQDPGKDNVLTRLAWVKRSRKLASDLKGIKVAPEGEHGKGSDAKPTGSAGALGLVSGRYNIPGAKKP